MGNTGKTLALLPALLFAQACNNPWGTINTSTLGAIVDGDSESTPVTVGSPSPSPSPSATVSPSPSPSPSISPSPSPSASVTPDLPYKVTDHSNVNHRNFTCASTTDCPRSIAPDANATIIISSNAHVTSGKSATMIATELRNGAYGLSPGDRLCIKSGTYSDFKITNLRGTLAHPIEITNCEGQITLNKIKNAILSTDSSRYYNLRADGDKETIYGISINNITDSGQQGVALTGKSRDFEVSWISVTNFHGFAAFMAKSDTTYTADPIDTETGVRFVQTNTHLHHNFISMALDIDPNVGAGEGFYIGYNNCSAGNLAGGTLSTEFRLKHVNLHDNVIQNTGSEGLQVACAIEDAHVHHNYLKHTGWLPFGGRDDQTGGLQIGTGATGVVNDNWVEDVKGNCLHVSGGMANPSGGPALLYTNNMVKSCGSFMYLNKALEEAVGTQTVRFENNTFDNTGRKILWNGTTEMDATYIHAWGSMRTFPLEFINNIFKGPRSAAKFVRFDGDSPNNSQATTALTEGVFTGNTFVP